MVAPTTLKKWATGNGRADKKAVRTAAEALYPELGMKTYDEADALILAHTGAFYRGFVDLPLLPHQRDRTDGLLAAVKWPETMGDWA
jgi:crossover junction endodeoxyribonuclease RuvC